MCIRDSIDDDGNIVVEIGEDAQPGDKITIVVKDEEGNEVDTVTVTVTEPEAPADNPNWKDSEGTPGGKVTIPNEGGPVPPGTTVEVEGPGSAHIDENGNIVVDINKDAKPGDKITITVKDKDGNILDQFVVTVTKKGVSLAATGFENTPLWVFAAGLLLAGGAMLTRIRRKDS